jgi:hypothetical protein
MLHARSYWWREVLPRWQVQVHTIIYGTLSALREPQVQLPVFPSELGSTRRYHAQYLQIPGVGDI